MQIEIPNDLVERLRQRSSDPVEVIREALDSLDARDRELIAIQAGLESADAGRSKSLALFDQEFRSKNGLT